LTNAEVILNKERQDEIIIRTDNEQFNVPFLKDSEGNVFCLDQEGAPLKLVSHFSKYEPHILES
jgi:hypothetical protein